MYPENPTALYSGHPPTLVRILQCTIEPLYIRSASLMDNDCQMKLKLMTDIIGKIPEKT